MKKIHVSISDRSIENAVKALENYQKWLLKKTQELLTALAQEGVSAASVNFGEAVYDGANDVEVKFEERGGNKVAVIATGKATLFIEFGTGISYPSNHPEADKNGMIRGEYGRKKGRNPKGWTYYGPKGSNGKPVPGEPGVIRTKGNPANMSMYETERELERKFSEIAKRVFNE